MDDRLYEVYIGLCDMGGSIGVYTLKTLNGAQTAWIDYPRAADNKFSIAGNQSFIVDLADGFYALMPASEETGEVAIIVSGHYEEPDIGVCFPQYHDARLPATLIE